MPDGYGRGTREQFAAPLSDQKLADLIASHQRNSAIDYANARDLRDDPFGKPFGSYEYRVGFWFKLGADEAAEARALLDILLARKS
jgi:hypothetical protein